MLLNLELNKSQVEKIIHSKAKRSKILISIILGVLVLLTVLNTIHIDIDFYWFVYFGILDLLCMPTLLNCSKDLKCYADNQLVSVDGKVLDLFLEDETKADGNWILILDEQDTKGETDYLLAMSPGQNIQVGDYVEISYTKLLRVPITVKKIDNIIEEKIVAVEGENI